MDRDAQRACRARWDSVAKPLSGLGYLEDAVATIALISGTADVDIKKRCVLVFCADNGVVREGVSQSGSEVTTTVAKSILAGVANVNCMARVASAEVFCVDAGMADPPRDARLLSRPVARGTKNICEGPAMTRGECLRALDAGEALAGEMARAGYRLLLTGEMGIGNTTTSSAMASVYLNLPVEAVTGRGAGLSDAGLERKISAIRRAIAVNRPDPKDPLDVLCKLGGFDIAMMAGAFRAGYRLGVPLVIDGFISAVAALTACYLEPPCREALLASHVSREPAGRLILDAIGATPVIAAGMALGEGTGAVALLPLIDMALAVYATGHRFGGIGLKPYERFGETNA